MTNGQERFQYLNLTLLFRQPTWCLGRAAVCDCGIPWTFLIPFFMLNGIVKQIFCMNNSFVRIPFFILFLFYEYRPRETKFPSGNKLISVAYCTYYVRLSVNKMVINSKMTGHSEL